MRNPSKNQSPVPFGFLFRKIKFFKINVFKTKFDMYQTLILWYIPHYFPKVWYYIFVSLLINTININNNKPLLIPDVIRNYILLEMENHRGGKENLRCYSLRSSKVQKRKYLQEKSTNRGSKLHWFKQLIRLFWFSQVLENGAS